MRKVRIFSEDRLDSDSEVELRGSAARHIGQVLRKQVGDPLVVFDGSGGEFTATIIDINKSRLLIRTGCREDTIVESTLQLSLWHGLCRGGRMDSVIQKATELGVSCIQPVITERSIIKPDQNKTEKRLQHWRKIAISACEQSGRTRLPDIQSPIKLGDGLGQLQAEHCAILLDPAGQQSLGSAVQPNTPTIILTGPEGGFTDAESQAAAAAGFTPVSLGPRIMRTETAPIVALGLVQYLAGDLAGEE